MEKRFYEAGEQVWSREDHAVAIVKKVNPYKQKLTAYVNFDNSPTTKIVTRDIWDFDKLRSDNKYGEGVIGFAKMRDTARIPSKNNREDAGYDVYLDFDKDFKTVDQDGNTVNAWSETGVLEVILRKGQVNILPTGIGVRVSDDFYTNWCNERGSTGAIGLKMVSGIVDSGYRGEVFLNIIPQVKDIVITNTCESVRETDDFIYYPYSKAISQMIVYRSLHLRSYEVEKEDFMSDETLRKDKKMGSSNK